MMMKKIKVYALLVCLLATSAAQAQSFGSAAMRKLQMAEFAISNFYVDKVDEDKLVEEAIIKMLAQLDPHSHLLGGRRSEEDERPISRQLRRYRVQFQDDRGHPARRTTRQQRTFRESGHPCRRPHHCRQRLRHRRSKNEHGRYHEASAWPERFESQPDHRPPWSTRPARVHREKR